MKTVYQTPKSMKLAIVSFENLTPNIKAGNDMARFCYNEMFSQLYKKYHGNVGGYNIELMDEYGIDAIMLKNKWLDVTSHMDVGMDKLTSEIGCDLLLIGTVSEFHYKRGLGEDPVASLHLRLLDVKDMTIIWSGSLSRVGRFSWFKEDALGRLGQQVSKELVAKCLNDIHDQVWPLQKILSAESATEAAPAAESADDLSDKSIEDVEDMGSEEALVPEEDPMLPSEM
ncbi:MAG: hypothetical protein HQL32_02300 [Planctomycetes bacterium]|nr:hypothetical protein [Planctomycetota bacterium]